MNEPLYPPDSTGALIVRVTTARGAIPLENAAVIVRGGDAENSGVLFSLRSDRDGRTPKILLPTPPKSNSLSPDGATPPFARYAIEVTLDGYGPLSFEGVPVFPGVVSIQPAVMMPLPEYFGVAQNHTPTTVIPEGQNDEL